MRAPASCADLGIVVALAAEAATLGAGRGRPGTSMRVRSGRVAVAGIGGERAAAAALRLIDDGARALLSWGVAGALSPRLAPGDLLLPSTIVTTKRTWSVDAAWREAVLGDLGVLGAHDGKLWCSALPVVAVAQKQALALGGMHAVDMESAAVAAVAARRGLPFIAVKSICDPAGRGLPAGVADLVGIDGRWRLSTLARLLRARPGVWRELNRLRIDYAVALAALRKTARAVPSLGPGARSGSGRSRLRLIDSGPPAAVHKMRENASP